MGRKRIEPIDVLMQRAEVVYEAIAHGPADDERLLVARQLLEQAAAVVLHAGNVHSAIFTVTDAHDLVTGRLTLEAFCKYQRRLQTPNAADIVRQRAGVCPLCEENFTNAGWTTFHDENGKHQTIYREESHRLARWHKHSTVLPVQ